MPLFNSPDILIDARQRGYAVPAVNVANIDMTLALIEAANRESSPLIIQIFRRLLDNGLASHLAPVIRAVAAEHNVPIILHLDHGISLEQVHKALSLGFTSVMLDASAQPLADNITMSQQAWQEASKTGAGLELELGAIPTSDKAAENDDYTKVEDAISLMAKTQATCLAVAVGTAHGYYDTPPRLDIQRLKDIAAAIDNPLVLHGGSGLDDTALTECISHGVSKINIATEFQQLYLTSIKDHIDPKNLPPVDIFMATVQEDLCQLAQKKMQLLNSSGKA